MSTFPTCSAGGDTLLASPLASLSPTMMAVRSGTASAMRLASPRPTDASTMTRLAPSARAACDAARTASTGGGLCRATGPGSGPTPMSATRSPFTGTMRVGRSGAPASACKPASRPGAPLSDVSLPSSRGSPRPVVRCRGPAREPEVLERSGERLGLGEVLGAVVGIEHRIHEERRPGRHEQARRCAGTFRGDPRGCVVQPPELVLDAAARLDRGPNVREEVQAESRRRLLDRRSGGPGETRCVAPVAGRDARAGHGTDERGAPRRLLDLQRDMHVPVHLHIQQRRDPPRDRQARGEAR